MDDGTCKFTDSSSSFPILKKGRKQETKASKSGKTRKQNKIQRKNKEQRGQMRSENRKALIPCKDKHKNREKLYHGITRTKKIL